MSIPRDDGRRQAVVIIHGMGEQRPMGTLRGFLKGTHHKDDQFYSRPYELTNASGQPNYDLRRYTTSERTGDQGEEDSYRMRTDFFELYWAHYFDTGSLRYVWKWIRKNSFHKPFWRHTKQVRRGIALLQITPILLLLVGLVSIPTLSFNFMWAAVLEVIARLGVVGVLGVIGVLGAVGVLIYHFLVRPFFNLLREVLADPPRYLVPEPKHVRARNEIRDEGVRLLREIHEKECYERVVVVGHSLGSIVGLDMLRLAWEEYRHPDPYKPLQNPAKDTELALRLDDIIHHFPEKFTPDQMRTWQDTQHQLWKECRNRGMRWLVTDFITLGSPLAHADWLMFDSSDDMKKSFREREYPTCPPDVGRAIFYEGKYKVDKTIINANPDALVPHHAALFAVTRWSNAYFPVYRWYGDPVGGDVAATFGKGVRDVKVRVKSCRRSSLKQFFLGAHLNYWNQYLDPDWNCPESDTALIQKRERIDRRTGTRVAHLVLQEFLQLDYNPDKAPDTEESTTPTEPEIALHDLETRSPVLSAVDQPVDGGTMEKATAPMVLHPHASGEQTPSDTLADAAMAEISAENIPPPAPESVIPEDTPRQTQSDQPPASV